MQRMGHWVQNNVYSSWLNDTGKSKKHLGNDDIFSCHHYFHLPGMHCKLQTSDFCQWCDLCCFHYGRMAPMATNNSNEIFFSFQILVCIIFDFITLINGVSSLSHLLFLIVKDHDMLSAVFLSVVSEEEKMTDLQL